MRRRPVGAVVGWTVASVVARTAAAATALLSAAAVAAQPTTGARRGGLDELGPALQAMQRDESQNPALLWVREGEALWAQIPPGSGSGGSASNARACSGCHGSAPLAVAASYPRYDTTAAGPLTLPARIDRCRVQHQQQPSQGADGPAVLALTAALHWAARGRLIAPDDDPRLQPWHARGQALWQQRLGQLNLACRHCHDERAGERLGGARIPQAHPTGATAYRLEWQAMGSLQRRLRACLVGVRAAPFAEGADEWRALELYLMQRAAGLPLEGAPIRP